MLTYRPCGTTPPVDEPPLDLPPPDGDIVDIDARWQATIHNPLHTGLTGLRFRLTATQPPGGVLISDLVVTAVGLTMTGAQDGGAGVWTSDAFDIPGDGDFDLDVTITHDDDSVLAGTVDLLGELVSASDVILASSTGTLTIEV